MAAVGMEQKAQAGREAPVAAAGVWMPRNLAAAAIRLLQLRRRATMVGQTRESEVAN